MVKSYPLHALLALCAALLTASCGDEAEWAAGEGTLRVVLADVSGTTHTRSTPSELGTPAAELFHISITDAAGRKVYGKPHTAADIPLAAGNYTVEASYGDNAAIAYDAPYYVGTATTTVETGKVAAAEVRCTVGNALVSARFGRDDAERERFDKFYSDYALQVWNGDKAATLPGPQSTRSAYFPAGTSVRLVFTGTLRADGRTVSTTLDAQGTGFPATFQAADHATVTLSLPDPESAAAVDISTVELTEATMAETIPLSWLPTPVATPTHTYDAQGLLTGTDIAFNNAYPGLEWRAVLTDAAGNTVRTAEGTGAIASRAADNAAEWPYIPAGTYTATYYVSIDGAMRQTKTADVTVAAPEITVTADAYTSYSKYLAGDVDAANACDAFTVYAPTASAGIAPALLRNARYGYTLTTTLGGNTIGTTTDGNAATLPDQTGIEPSLTPHALTATVHFGGTTASATKEVRITGLPATYNPPTKADWSGSGTVSWEGDHVRLGRNTMSQPQSITCNRLAVPAGTKVEAPYSVMMHGATVATTLSLSFGSDTYFSEKSPGGAFVSKDVYYEDTKTFTVSADATQAKANNSYGSGQTCSRIYYMNFLYGK